MQYKFFTIPVNNPTKEKEEELNAFLLSHTIVETEKQLIKTETDAYWTFCIKYIANTSSIFLSQNEKKEKTDFKAILDEKTFDRFSRLREIRKQIANREAIPAYAVFTNDELIEIAKMEILNTQNMLQHSEIGNKKVEKYGEEMILEFNKNC